MCLCVGALSTHILPCARLCLVGCAHARRSNSYEGNLFTWLFLGPTLNVSEQFYESFWAFAMARYLPPTANVTLLKELYDPIANSSVRRHILCGVRVSHASLLLCRQSLGCVLHP